MPNIDEIFESSTQANSQPNNAYPFKLVSRGVGDLKTRYRPQKFEEVASTCSLAQLKKLVDNPKASRIFLFEGNTGSGKTTCARIVAKANICLDQKTENKPCLNCKNCQNFDRNWDVFEINVADHRKIENARELVQDMAYRPQFLGKKIYILDEVQQLTPEAQQVLLKHLEEPPDYLWVFLCTTNKHDLNQALIDRACNITFKPISPIDASYVIEQVLKNEGKEASSEIKKSFLENAHGSVRALLNNIQAYLENGYDPNIKEDEELKVETRDLARALLDANWNKAAEYLKSPIFRGQAETQRIALESYVRAIAIKSPNTIKVTGYILNALHGTLVSEPLPYNGLVLKCIKACQRSN